MSNGELLQIHPVELQFPFELKKQISSSLQLSNKSDDYVAFKVKTTNPKKYCVRPNTGIVMPRSTCEVIVTMQAQKEAPPDMQCKDKFLLQSVIVSPGTMAKDITPEMFNKESGNHVEEVKLRVAYVPPQPPPSPVREGSEEGSSPRASISENGAEFHNASRTYAEPQDNSSETKALILKLSEEKKSAIQQNNKLKQELELLRRESSRRRGGIPFMYVIIVGLVGLFLGYLLKKT
ncbi:vesicle-associated protein 1-1 isoform X1 [Solanum tuberosum]|uniref:VAP27 n=1 Tax=Solanum tuberosum TaxID=4113 RepID=M1CGE1_SOLTU|nr:PREDICTED: vesicle-associated protein 1-1 isoform X1 [Solanum tuberosum]